LPGCTIAALPQCRAALFRIEVAAALTYQGDVDVSSREAAAESKHASPRWLRRVQLMAADVGRYEQVSVDPFIAIASMYRRVMGGTNGSFKRQRSAVVQEGLAVRTFAPVAIKYFLHLRCRHF
jgi:hypothetical protein